jgi:pescadillo protein
MGTQVTWISPYKFNQRLPFDIDYKVMSTFLEFYQGLLKFVNYKLFADIGVTYPLEADMIPMSVTSPYLDCPKVRQL